MVKKIINNKTVLIADEGKVLVRNGIGGKRVVLGAKDSELNWTEKDEAELTLNEELPAEEALGIRTGGDGNGEE